MRPPARCGQPGAQLPPVGYPPGSGAHQPVRPRASPRVRLRGRAPRAGPDLVEPVQGLLAELDLQGPQRLLQLLQGPGPDDRPGHALLVEQPGQGHVRGPLAQLVAERLVLLDLGAVLLQPPARTNASGWRSTAPRSRSTRP